MGAVLAGAKEAHDKYWESIMMAGAQNPRFLYDLAETLYNREKEFVDHSIKNQQGNPYDWPKLNIPDKAYIDNLMKEWPVNPMFKRVPKYVSPEILKNHGANIDEKDEPDGKKQPGGNGGKAGVTKKVKKKGE